MEEEEDEFYSIDRDNAHLWAVELVPEDFFWRYGNELAYTVSQW